MGKIIYGTERPDEIGPAGDPITEIPATNHGDVIYGNEGADNICGLGGNDKIYGGSDADQLDGGSGNDRIYGDAINNMGRREFVSKYDQGSDQIRGREGHDRMFGNGGNDTIWGEEDNDTLFGGGGKDELYGGIGDDVLVGGQGHDILDGADGNDVLDGGGGNDWLDGDAGNDALTGGRGHDGLRGGTGEDNLAGGLGNDTLNGNEGNDVLFGGSNDDDLKGNEGDDFISGDSGNDRAAGNSGNDTLMGGSGYDKLDGGDGNDIIDGGYYADTIIGGSGSDILTGGGHYIKPFLNGPDVPEEDMILHRPYGDTFVWKQGQNAGDIDVITDWHYGDQIVLCGQLDFRVTKIVYENAEPSTSYRENDVRIFLSDGGQILVLNASRDFEEGLDNPLTPWGLENTYGNMDDFYRIPVATPGQFSHPACNVFIGDLPAHAEPTPFDLWPQDNGTSTT